MAKGDVVYDPAIDARMRARSSGAEKNGEWLVVSVTTSVPGESACIWRWVSIAIALSSVHSMKTRRRRPNFSGVVADGVTTGRTSGSVYCCEARSRCRGRCNRRRGRLHQRGIVRVQAQAGLRRRQDLQELRRPRTGDERWSGDVVVRRLAGRRKERGQVDQCRDPVRHLFAEIGAACAAHAVGEKDDLLRRRLDQTPRRHRILRHVGDVTGLGAVEPVRRQIGHRHVVAANSRWCATFWKQPPQCQAPCIKTKFAMVPFARSVT